MKQFDHFILTRYNVGLYRDDSKILDKAAWLNHRNKLFARYCRASVDIQTNKYFRWIIAIDPATPDISFLDGLGCSLVKASTWGEALLGFQSRIYALADAEWVVTSRLDNDDALNTGYVQYIADHFIPEHRVFLNFGICYKLMEKGHVVTRHSRIHDSNVASLIENCSDVKTVFYARQGTFSQFGRVVHIDGDDPMSLTVVHERNLYNRFSGHIVAEGEYDAAMRGFPFIRRT